MPTALRRPAGRWRRAARSWFIAGSPTVRDLAGWAAVVAVGAALTAAAAAGPVDLGSAAPPFVGRYTLRLDPATALAPAVGLAVLLAARRGVLRRWRWGLLLAAGYLAGLAWTLSLAVVEGRAGLAAPLTRPGSYGADVPAGASLTGLLRHFVADAGRHTAETRLHPPGPLLLLAGLHRLGLTDPALVGLVLAATGCLAVPLVATAVRSLCHEPAARRLLPVLVLAPYALWVAVSMDAVTLSLCAAAVTAGTVGSDRRRPFPAALPWALAAGLLLGVAALFSYSAAWLGTSLIVVYFVRRRPLLNVASALGALVPLALAARAGFSWAAGLASAQSDLAARLGPSPSWPLWALLDLLVVALATGPLVAAALRKLRRTPGWPFLVGAGLAVGFAVVSGLSRGGVERSFLPFFPWLLVPAVAPERRGGTPGPVLALAAVGAAGAVLIEAVLRSPW